MKKKKKKTQQKNQVFHCVQRYIICKKTKETKTRKKKQNCYCEKPMR